MDPKPIDCLGLAVVGNFPPHKSPRHLARAQFDALVEHAGNATGVPQWEVLDGHASVSVWRQGRRCLEAMVWTSTHALPALPSWPSRAWRPLQASAQWARAALDPAPLLDEATATPGVPWPRPGLPNPDPRTPLDVAIGASTLAARACESEKQWALSSLTPWDNFALAQALPSVATAWRDQLLAMPPAPPFAHAALAADVPRLRAELHACAWDKANLQAWWDLVAGLLDAGWCCQAAFPLGETGPATLEPLPISKPEQRDAVLRELGAGLPRIHRNASRLARLFQRASEPGLLPRNANPVLVFPPEEVAAVEAMLADWTTPARFWALCRHLTLDRLRSGAGQSAQTLADFRRLPRATAHRALDKLVKQPGSLPAMALDLVPAYHAAAPHWPGWPGLLGGLERARLLGDAGLALAASLRALGLDQALRAPDEARSRPRL